MTEFVIVLIVIGIFAALAPVGASKKRADTQKMLARTLLERKFAVAEVVRAGGMTLYTDTINRRWFVRRGLYDLEPEIYGFDELSGFSVCSDGAPIVRALPGKPVEGVLLGGSTGEGMSAPEKGGTCGSLQVLIRLHGDRSPEIVIPLLKAPASRRLLEYRSAIAEARDAARLLASVQGSPLPGQYPAAGA